MRVNMKLDKNREESYAHHAVDAMLIAFSQLGYEAYRKLQGEFIDFETGEILNAEKWNAQMSDEIYEQYLYGKKWSNIRTQITKAEKQVKYWYHVDHKSNRGLCNQTIRGTRTYEGKTYKINKLDIRTKRGLHFLKSLHLVKKRAIEKSYWFIKMIKKHMRISFKSLRSIRIRTIHLCNMKKKLEIVCENMPKTIMDGVLTN